jgi:hypothetical protein
MITDKKNKKKKQESVVFFSFEENQIDTHSYVENKKKQERDEEDTVDANNKQK